MPQSVSNLCKHDPIFTYYCKYSNRLIRFDIWRIVNVLTSNITLLLYWWCNVATVVFRKCLKLHFCDNICCFINLQHYIGYHFIV